MLASEARVSQKPLTEKSIYTIKICKKMKMDIQSYLKEWALNYFKNRDLIARNIEKIDSNDGDLVIKYKDRTETVKPLGNLSDFNVKQKSNDYINLICFNTRNNFDFLLKNWEDFIEFLNLKILFINPFSETEHKWIISPSVHVRISDDQSLKKGLLAIFETVSVLHDEEIGDNIKNIERL